jgi:SsrA-binding protein
LLLHAHEIDELAQRTREKGFSIVPLRLYFVKGRAKIEIGIGRGKKLHDKRHTLRAQQDEREAQRAMSLRQPR